MSENMSIQIGLNLFDESDFLLAVQDESTCNDCKYCQINAKNPNLHDGWYCLHKDNLQLVLHGEKFMDVSPSFLCNNFEAIKEDK